MKFILNLKFVFVLDENERGIGDNFLFYLFFDILK